MVYKDKIVKVPVEKIITKKVPVEKIIYKDKIIEKEVKVEVKVEVPVEKIVYKDRIVKPKRGYIKKKNIYANNDIFRDIEEMLAKQFYNVPIQERARRIYSLISQMNVDKKIQYEYEKENGKT